MACMSLAKGNYYINSIIFGNFVQLLADMLQCRCILMLPNQIIFRCLQISSRYLAIKASTISSYFKPKSKASAQPEERPPMLRNSQSFMMNLFRGDIHSHEVFPYPDILNAEQRQTLGMLIDPVEKFFTEVNDATKNDTEEKVSDQSLAGLWELGLFGLHVPQELGGLGLTNTQYARLVEIVGGNDLAVGITLGSHQSIGFKGILLFGTPEQKAKYLPRVTTEKQYAAFCLTESSAGSDAGSIKTRAVLSPDGKHYILNGSKTWISNGGICEVMTVFAQTPVMDKSGNAIDRVTAFIVERGFGGVTSGQAEKKMGIRASNTTEVFFEDVKVPVENVLGDVGAGFKVAMNILNNGRFGMGAALSGTMRSVMQKAVAFATSRKQFGRRIDSFGAIQEKLARMSMLHYVTESMTYIVSGNMDSGSKEYHLEAAIAKVFASEAAWKVTDEAIQIMGGMGFMRETGLERVLRDVRIFRIFEGTNDILRLFIALTGIQYAGTHLGELKKAFKSPTANLGQIFSLAKSRIVYSVGLSTPPSMHQFIHPSLKKSSTEISKSIERFGRTIESVLLRHGKGIVDEQFILNRIAEAAIDIYASVVVLSRATDSLNKNLPSSKHEMLMTQVWCNEASKRVAINLRDAIKQRSNFKKMTKISKNVCESGGFVQKNPVGL